LEITKEVITKYEGLFAENQVKEEKNYKEYSLLNIFSDEKTRITYICKMNENVVLKMI
jgi:hypothetical protein